MNQVITGLAASTCLVAQSLLAAIEPASMPLGPVAFTPTINIQTGYDDNILNASNNEIDSIKTIITPNFQVVAEDGLNAYRLQYALSKGIFHSSSDDNYLDHKLSFDAHLEFNARNALDLNASISKNHDDRGTGITETGSIGAGTIAPLEYNIKSIASTYTYGSDSATGRLVLSGKYDDKEYQNFRTITQQRDNTLTTLSAVFYYRIQPKTSMVFEIRNQNVDYTTDTAISLDSNTQRYYVGATWEGTAKTTGTIKLGHVNKDFDSDARSDFSGKSWEADIKWEPRTYSTFNLKTSQSEKESSGTGDLIDSKTARINWTHDWNDQLQTIAGLGYTRDNYRGDTAGRKDNTKDARVQFNYDLRRWLSFGLSYSLQDTDSNIAGIPFDRNIVLLSVTGSL